LLSERLRIVIIEMNIRRTGRQLKDDIPFPGKAVGSRALMTGLKTLPQPMSGTFTV
jgi:hypothetical protein